MQRDGLYLLLQSAIERSNGGMTWNDVIASIEQLRRAKVQEQLGSTLAGLTVADLTAALEVAISEMPKALSEPPVAIKKAKSRV